MKMRDLEPHNNTCAVNAVDRDKNTKVHCSNPQTSCVSDLLSDPMAMLVSSFFLFVCFFCGVLAVCVVLWCLLFTEWMSLMLHWPSQNSAPSTESRVNYIIRIAHCYAGYRSILILVPGVVDACSHLCVRD